MLLVLGIMSGALLAIGALADRLLVNREKRRIYDALESAWITLDDTEVPDLPRVGASIALKGAGRVIGPKLWSWRAFGVSIVLSWVLTSAAGLIGTALDGVPDDAPLYNRLPYISLFIWNWLLDALTAALTLVVLRKLSTSSRAWAVGWVAADIVLAWILAITCIAGGVWLTEVAIQGKWPGTAGMQRQTSRYYATALERYHEQFPGQERWGRIAEMEHQPLSGSERIQGAAQVVNEVLAGTSPSDVKFPPRDATVVLEDTTGQRSPPQPVTVVRPVGHYLILYGFTTLIPTTAVLGVILLLVIARLLLELMRRLGMRIAEATTDSSRNDDWSKFRPCTLVATVLVVFLWIVRGLVVLRNL